MRCAILTANKLRHIFFANKLAKINPEALLYENKINSFSEELVFKDHLEFDDKLKTIKTDDLNSQESFDILNALELDFIFIFGCSFLKK